MSAPPPKTSIPRSPAGLLTTHIPVDDRLGTSPSGQSALSGSSASTPSHMHQPLKRRSTGTSGGPDDYYFSSYAGVASSSTSSLSMSPGAAHEMMFASSPTMSHTDMSRGPSRQDLTSQANLRDLIHEEEEAESESPEQYLSRLPRPPYSQYSSDDRGNPANGRIHINTRPSDDSRTQTIRQDSTENQVSPSYSHSTASHYSSSDLSSDNESFGFDVNGAPLNGLMGPRSEAVWPRSVSRVEVRESVDSSITVMDQYNTPLNPQNDRFDTTPQNARYPTTHLSPLDYNTPTSPGSTSDRTPTLGGPVMSSGRLANITHPMSSKSSLISERTFDANREEPRSAPPTQTEFGINMGGQDDEGEETIKGRNRRTMPPNSLSGMFTDTLLSPDKEPRQSISGASDRDLSPSKSPQPPPRSTLRPQMNLPSPRRPPQNPASPAPDDSAISPKSRFRALPTIINTDSSPQRSDASSQGGPSRPERSPTRSVSSINSSATINDLTEMLGGAIDAIGLIDSRDTPPPTIMEPKKDRGLSVPTLSAPAEVVEAPKNLPARAASLPGTSFPTARMQPMRQVSGGSISSLQEYNMIQGVPTARPWPAAMMYGGIKRLRAPGDRAKAYAKGINDLAKAESGLREWCIASIEHAYRPEAARPRKASKMQSLGVKAPVSSTLVPEPMHPRQVSSGSEFPMRADSYTAREISTRMIDPLDEPTALPNNLPYPQLQQQYQIGGGMKPSPSMQSVTSVSSKKGFFSSAIGRIGGKRENYSLGPPSGNYQPPGAAKRDVKGLAISGPSYSNSEAPTTRASVSGSAPMGPRNPRGSYTPPVGNSRASTDMPSRVSLDQGLARMSSVRSSFDSARQGKMSAPPRSSPMATNNPTVGGGGITVSDEAMRQMGDVLPHVERGTLRIYLQRYLDPMRAIGAYLEDEKRGTVLR